MIMMNLSTKQIYVTQPTPPVPITPPALPVQFVKPLSYEFRVAEVIDENGKIESVKLQMQIWEHDEFGTGTIKQSWTDVPRYKFTKDGIMMTP
jgi:hypothetical protein